MHSSKVFVWKNRLYGTLNQTKKLCGVSNGLIDGKRKFHGDSYTRTEKWYFLSGTAALFSGGGLILYDKEFFRRAHAAAAATSQQREDFKPPLRSDLPTYKLEDVKKHGKESNRIWVTFDRGVYDITEFVESHPGGDKILMAAGGSLEPFWALYAQHKTQHVFEILETLRVGNIDPEEVAKATKKTVDISDPFSGDPLRHPALKVNSEKPFNAESPPSLLVESFLTPNPLFFVRNHLPVPKVDPSKHRLKIEGIGITKEFSLSVEDIREKFEQVSVTSAIQCAGNRRANMNEYKKVQGLMWDGTAISNAKWTGARLRDILILAGVDPHDTRIKHIHLEGADCDHSGQHYGASITFEKAMNPEVIVAHKMNDEDIPDDHGYPLRLVAPGIVGARQVKWLANIKTSDVESPSHWQQKDYKAFSPAIGFGETLPWDKVPSIQEYPVQSAICVPERGAKVSRADGTVDVKGYAWSGGGRGIIRVEVSVDGGKTWELAELTQDPDQELDHMWAWTLWEASVKLPEGVEEVELVCKATDRAYNTQPETPNGIWNVRGLINNAYHRVKVKVVE